MKYAGFIFILCMAPIWVISPGEAAGPGMLLVHPGFSGECDSACPAAGVPRAGTWLAQWRTGPRDANRRETVCCSVLDFLFLLSRVMGAPQGRWPPAPTIPGPPLPTWTLTLGSSRPQLCFLGPLFNLLEENEGRKSFQISSHCLGEGGHSNAPLPLIW